MYIQHFGFAQYPFSLTPNTRYFLKLPSHERAFETLMLSLTAEGSFVQLTGEIGTGKTLLCRMAINALDLHSSKYLTAYIPHPVLDEKAMIEAIAEELGIVLEPDTSYYETLKVLTENIKRLMNAGKELVLFIDEAQAIPEESLEAVYLLTTIRSTKNSSLKVILFGQPELKDLLDCPVLKQVREATSNSFDLPALDREGCSAYIDHRLMKAGYSGHRLFSEDAVDMIFQQSRGIPRLVNIICHKALMSAFGKGDHKIEPLHVEAAVADTDSLH